VEWIYVARDREEWQIFTNTLMNHRDPSKGVSVLSASGDGQVLKKCPNLFLDSFKATR
jgi:hypothetical protein